DAVVLREVGRVDRDAGHGQRRVVERRADRAAQYGGPIQRSQPGHARELRHQAPSRLWPQTRTTLPVTPPDAGLASQAMVSATSIGRPPCDRLFIRRPASRIIIGIAAVIFVSMKPGATALIVMPCVAHVGAIDSTRP